MMKKLTLSEDYRLWLLLNKTRSSIYKLRHKKVGQYLPPNQAAAMVTVWLLDGQATPLEVSRQLFLEPHSVSELVDRMERKGLVSKRKDPRKKNVVRLSITEKGRELCEKVMGKELIRDVMSSLKKEEQEQLWSLLSKVFKASLLELGVEEEDFLLP
jgi:DNA-binding MarR family transcriptional regulator